MIAQAIAFNVFLSFFPTLLLAVGFASSWIGNKMDALDAIRDFTDLVPPGSHAIVADYLSRRGPDVWKISMAGAMGTLLGGSQVMKLLMNGIHLIYGEPEQMGFFHRQWRGLLLFIVVCSFGAIANIGIANTLYETHTNWSIAGAIGAVIGVVWNYAVSATLVWRAR